MMGRLFQSYVIVDWSAAAAPKAGPDSVWIGALTPDARFRMQFEAFNPDTRAKARALLADTLAKLTRRGDRVLVGFDFSLGYPAGTAAALGLDLTGKQPWEAMHAFLLRELKDKDDNSNNRFPLAARMNRLMSGGPFPFWGASRRDEVSTLSQKKPREHGPGDPAEFRLTEIAARERLKARPQPVWKLAYAGAVGGQTMTGIPSVATLRAALPQARIWPFETGWRVLDDAALEGVSIVLAEVYPTLAQAVPEKGEIKDRAQVRTLCEVLHDRDSAGLLASDFAPAKATAEDHRIAVETEEGWILGV